MILLFACHIPPAAAATAAKARRRDPYKEIAGVLRGHGVCCMSSELL